MEADEKLAGSMHSKGRYLVWKIEDICIPFYLYLLYAPTHLTYVRMEGRKTESYFSWLLVRMNACFCLYTIEEV
jgi:hypothetical protein